MNTHKDSNREHARKILTTANIKWISFNHDNHWKIGEVDFWPTTWRWIDNKANFRKEGCFELVEYLRSKYHMQTYVPNKGVFTLQGVQPLTVEQMFTIVKKSKATNLEKICKVLHKEIYG